MPHFHIADDELHLEALNEAEVEAHHSQIAQARGAKAIRRDRKGDRRHIPQIEHEMRAGLLIEGTLNYVRV